MHDYTELLNIKAENITSEDEDFAERLLEVASLFRSFGDALTAFMQDHGYDGHDSDNKEKAAFLREKFKAAKVNLPHDFKEWFIPDREISRDTAFKICFAFALDVNETEDFFKCVKLERGFDCHTISEAVYYFCMKTGRSWADAQEIIKRIPKEKPLRAVPSNTDQEVLYTSTIKDFIDSIDDPDELIDYIKSNGKDFRYNNVTAINFIQTLWKEIEVSDGIAYKEGLIIDSTRNRYDIDAKKEIIKAENYAIVGDGSPSSWTIFSQVIGLSNGQKQDFSTNTNRSLSSFLADSALMPFKASYCFPSQQNIDKLLRGETGDHEIFRKMLIFLVFYRFWAKKVIENDNPFYEAKTQDSRSCLAAINKFLLDSGYPELYAGNPYDWIFLWASQDETPLEAFRFYMREILTIKAETAPLKSDGQTSVL